MPIWYRNFDVSKCVPNVISNTVFETLFFKLVSFVQKKTNTFTFTVSNLFSCCKYCNYVL